MSADKVTEDAVLGGRLVLRQPLRGHRVGHDAILLAAATVAQSGQHAVDLGSGVGGAGLALARRIEGLNVTLVDIDPALTELAAGNAQRNGLSDRVRAVRLDVESSAADFIAAGLPPGSAACVLMNPPFNVVQQPSPDQARRLAHAATEGTLERWLRTAARLLHADGVVTLIWRADGLADVLAALANGLRSNRRAAGPPQAGRIGDPRAGAGNERKPGAARAIARFSARRCRRQTDRGGRSHPA